MKQLLLAPFTMHRRVVDMIKRETKHARDGKPARIVAKMNALLEEGVIRALYAASQAGVEHRPHRSRRVRAASGRAAGCPRTFACARSSAASSSITASGISKTAATPDVWLSSADWMGRNLFRRIEVAFPVRDPELQQPRRRRGAARLPRRHAATRGRSRSDGAWRKIEAARARAAALGAIASCSRGCAKPRTPTDRGSRALATCGSRARRAGSRPPAHRERRQAGRADGRVARSSPARHGTHSRLARRPRAADRARAQAQVQDRRTRSDPARRSPPCSRRPTGPTRARRSLIVGHQPTLGAVASFLLSGEEAFWSVKKGAVWWLIEPRQRRRRRRSSCAW